MVLSLNENFRRVFSQPNPQPNYLVTMRVGSGTVEGVDQFTFSTKPGLGYPVCIDVGEMAVAVDVITREINISARSILFRRGDGVFASIATSHRLLGKQVTIKLGSLQLDDVADYITIGTLCVVDLIPDETTFELKCAPAAVVLKDRYVGAIPAYVFDPPLANRSAFVNKHPYQAILTALVNSSAPPSLYNASSLDPDNHPTISHYNVMRGWPSATSGNDLSTPPEPRFELELPAKDVISHLLMLTLSTFHPDENGIYQLRRYDQNAAPVRSWGRQDILRASQKSTWENLHNEFQWEVGKVFEKSFHCTQRDAGSQSAHAYPGEVARVISESFDSEFLNGCGVAEDSLPFVLGEQNYIVATTTSFRVAFAGENGFSGARFNPSAFTQDASAELGSGRVAYLMLCGTDRRYEGAGVVVNDRPEIVRCNAISLDYLGEHRNVQAADGYDYPQYIRYHLDTSAPNGGRAQFESTPVIPQSWRTGTVVVDVTLIVEWCQTQLARLAYGAPPIEIWTNLREVDVQIGDFITAPGLDSYLHFGKDGAGDDTIFEVVSKEIRALDDSPGIRWEVVFVRDDVQPATDPTFVPDESGELGVVYPTPSGAVIVQAGDDVLVDSGDRVYVT